MKGTAKFQTVLDGLYNSLLRIEIYRNTAVTFEIREAEITSLAGIVDVRAFIYDCIETFSVALKATPLLRVTFFK